jgi:undecaprenyl-phosphate galactose phosphotransferase
MASEYDMDRFMYEFNGPFPQSQSIPKSKLKEYFRKYNNLLIHRNRLLKRTLDLCCSLLFLGITIPVMALIAILIKFDSPGPVIHSGKRLGKDGRMFKCYKFRTMDVREHEILKEYLTSHPEAAKEWQQYAKLRTFDPRVTKAGKWLRKFSLDELPQIVNVLLGEMSLVGPRPYLPSERERMSFYEKIILDSVPGITGLWQVRGRNDITFEERLSLESWYVRNWSIWLDIMLLFKTIEAVIGRRGAC